jgi:hypothetical protein
MGRQTGGIRGDFRLLVFDFRYKIRIRNTTKIDRVPHRQITSFGDGLQFHKPENKLPSQWRKRCQ